MGRLASVLRLLAIAKPAESASTIMTMSHPCPSAADETGGGESDGNHR
jgi:hypothetical protein